MKKAILKETNGMTREYTHFTAKQLFDELWDAGKIDTERFIDENTEFHCSETTEEQYIEFIEDYASAYDVEVVDEA